MSTKSSSNADYTQSSVPIDRPETVTSSAETTWGRTSNDKLFSVPVTHDMMFNMLSHFPPSPKTHSVFELATLGYTLFQAFTMILAFVFYGSSGMPLWLKAYFMLMFLAFRAGYNAGLGHILMWQSTEKWFTNMCKKSGYFDADTASKTESGKKWYAFLKRQLSIKMGNDYSFDDAPIEFNSWLLFRQLVDFILINDFVAYIVFTLVFFHYLPLQQVGLFDLFRFIAGIALIAFNIWVKLDAHRVVKDFAWYWGDFFFLVDKNLTFDGVFEMCFHPMYSVGYAGYYGLSLMANSYAVLFVSLLAHAAQFIFLYSVEEPHIKKTYGSNSPNVTAALLRSDQRAYEILYGRDPQQAYFRRDLIVFKNFDWFRSTDLILAWSVFSTFFLALPFPKWTTINIPAWFCIATCVFWRFFHTIALGISLQYQSRKKTWTKHFIKFGGTNRDAFASWKTVYNFSLTMTYVSFIAAAFKTFSMPSSWQEVIGGPFLLQQVFGILLILMHIWMSVSVFDALGDFGWFYGDFFIDEFPAELHYTGIYRYLNNPEKTLGLAAFWGFALISGDRWMVLVTVFSHMANWWFLEYVESPHMQKLYGPKVRKESGVIKTIKKQLANPVKKTLENQKFISDVNKVLGEVNKIGTDVVNQVEKLVIENVADKVKSEVEKVVERAKPAIEELLAETKTIVAETTSRLATIRTGNDEDSADFEDIDTNEYSLQLPVVSSSPYRASGFVSFTLGEPISVYWTAPADHHENDWIGIYKITANPSKGVTTTSSKGCWNHIGAKGEKTGQIVFSGDKLPWELGIYEFRYHFNNKYLVLASTAIFEIKVDVQPVLDDSLLVMEPISPVDLGQTNAFESYESQILPEDHPNSYSTIISIILPVYKRALNQPKYEATQHFSAEAHGTEIHAKRIAYTIKQLYGIEFSWKTIMFLEPTADRMVERIQEARITLAPTILEERKEKKEVELKPQVLAKHLELIQAEREERGRKRSRSRMSNGTRGGTGYSTDYSTDRSPSSERKTKGELN